MDSIAEIKDSNSFINHMTNFDDQTKSTIMNVMQYSMLSIIPLILFKKFISPLFPEVDENKGSLEISIEVLLQVAAIFIGLFVIHRLVTYLTPYSGKEYPEVNLIVVSLTLLFVLLSFETQLAEKVDILTERVVELWNGEPSAPAKEESKEKVRVKQPIAVSQPAPQHQNSRADYLSSHQMMQPQQSPQTTQINSLPNYASQTTSVPQMQQQPSFDQMYTEPMAANESFVGGGGFSAF